VPFSIACDWISLQRGPPELAATSALLEIKVGKTLADSDVPGSFRNRRPLAAYPLAMWLAGSWWRLRWESLPPRGPTPEWHLSHDMSAASGAFRWPSVKFLSDGENVQISARPSFPATLQRLLCPEAPDELVSGRDFESAVDVFVGQVCARLQDLGITGTPLQRVWREVRLERGAPELAEFRQLEAILGFDPDEATPQLMGRFISLHDEAGSSAAEEIAHAAAGDTPQHVLDGVLRLVQQLECEGRVNVSPGVREAAARLRATHAPAWVRGSRLAQALRRIDGLAGRLLSNKDLAGLLQLPEEVLRQGKLAQRAPLSIGVRNTDSDRIGFFFAKQHSTARRFEAARLLGDYLMAPAADQWLPATDASTFRQKAQRAFAAELLCPIEELKHFLDGDFSEESILLASDHFQASPLMLQTHLASHYVAGSSRLAA
jgi:hypothetical protein